MKNNILTQKAMAYVLASLIIVSTSLIYCASPRQRIVLGVDIEKKQVELLELNVDSEKTEEIKELLMFDQWRKAIDKNEQDIEINLKLINKMLKKSSRDPLLSEAVYCMQPGKRTRSNFDLGAPAPKKARSNEPGNLDEFENNDPEYWKNFWPF